MHVLALLSVTASIVLVALLVSLPSVSVVSAQCIASITTASGSRAPASICSGDLIFDENFREFNLDTWNHEITAAGGGNWEFQVYINNRSNSYVKDEALFIKPTLTSGTHGDTFLTSGTLGLNGGSPADECTNPSDWGCERRGTDSHVLNPITSARIRTVNSFNFRYGKVEVRAKFPSGDWIWSAITLLPRHNEYGNWPASGEMDLTEVRGNRHLMLGGRNIGTELSASTLHFGPYFELNQWQRAHFQKTSQQGRGFDQQFHRYQLEWTDRHIKFSIDDQELGTVTPPRGGFWDFGEFGSSSGATDNPWRHGTKMAPFDKEFYFVIKLAVGGVNGYFPDIAQNPGGKPWSNTSPQASTDFWNGRNQWLPTWNLDVDNGERPALKVDYIKVWAI
ncbi:beta-1,3-glucan-binding protein-like [Periplaneta americana]|uniref:beta-1,3-glucan-binding protein-like n=1 Tax=Periplaneta americana TaxID=6978 RepID=UPI0037E7403A